MHTYAAYDVQRYLCNILFVRYWGLHIRLEQLFRVEQSNTSTLFRMTKPYYGIDLKITEKAVTDIAYII